MNEQIAQSSSGFQNWDKYLKIINILFCKKMCRLQLIKIYLKSWADITGHLSKKIDCFVVFPVSMDNLRL
jgi:hypothetical protein